MELSPSGFFVLQTVYQASGLAIYLFLLCYLFLLSLKCRIHDTIPKHYLASQWKRTPIELQFFKRIMHFYTQNV